MAIGIDDVDDFDLSDLLPTEEIKPQEEETLEEENETQEEETQETTEELEEEETQEETQEDDDLITSLLKSKGIDDPSKIKFENADGSIEELDWNSLTREELMNILNNKLEDSSDTSDTDLDDSEIDLINRLRLSNMSPADFLATVKQQGVKEYLASQEAPAATYTVDDLTDEELYALDLLARVTDITDEEIKEALDRATSNPDLFKKEIAGIREEYKKLEDDKNQQDAAIKQQLAQELFTQYANGVANSISNFNNIGELDIDMNDDDMNELYTFLTGQNASGESYFLNALNDYDTLVRMGWFALKGQDVINSISEYYKNEITRAHRAGLEEGMKKATPKKDTPTRKVVVKKPETKENKHEMTIDDIDL